MPRTLPVELLDHILGDDSLDHADLARCCLVSRTLFARARPRLYAAKTYLLDGDGKLTKRTQACGAATEHIAVNDEHLDHIFDPLLLVGANLRTLLAVNFSKDVYELLFHLPNLKHLGLRLVEGTAYPEPGDRPPPTFRLESLNLYLTILDENWASTLDATLANSYASIRKLEYAGRNYNKVFATDTFPSVETLCIGLCDDDDLVTILGGSKRIKSISIRQHQSMTPDPLGVRTCPRALGALPPTVRAYHVFQFPNVDHLTHLLAALPNDVHLDELGVSPGVYDPEEACPSDPQGIWTRRWHAQKEQWDALEAACAAEGIKLVLTRNLFFPAEARTPEDPERREW
ncbi:hypothetical protein JCM8208_005305 [Rhodotorula glutinis]